MSSELPAGAGTTILTARLGQACDQAAGAAIAQSRAAANSERRRMGVPGNKLRLAFSALELRPAPPKR